MQGLAEAIRRELPYLRRYARALSGEQRSGDQAVKACLERLLVEGGPDNVAKVRLVLFQALHRVWTSGEVVAANSDLEAPVVASRLVSLAPLKRQALLLTTLEGFSANDA